MNLNRNNYEEFFLLYVDNELPDAGRKAVEAFIRQNPDLEGELILLQGTKMKPENNVIFEHKELLLKHGEKDSPVNLTNYQDFFLLYIDGELNAEFGKMVEEFAARDPFLQKELLSFQQARIEPDENLVFEGKEILYREEKRIWLLPRISIAAAVLLFIFGGYYAFNLTITNKKPSVVILSAKNATPAEIKIKEPAKKDQLAVTVAAAEALYPSDKLNGKSRMEIRNQRQGNQQKRRELHKTYKTITPEVVSPSLEIAGIKGIPLGAQKSNIIPLADHTSILDPSADKEDGIDLANASEGKSKMRGIFRKVTRIFEKTTSAGEDKGKRGILIGGFQIALK